MQVGDKQNLEYQAGEEEQEGSKKPDQAAGKDDAGQQEQPTRAQEPEQADGGEEEGTQGGEGPINEDTEDRYEDRQFAAPEVGW